MRAEEIERQFAVFARDRGNDRRRSGLARLVGQRKIERPLRQRRIARRAKLRKQVGPGDGRRARLGHAFQLVPFGRAGVAGDDPDPVLLQRAIERVGIGIERGKAAARLGNNAGFADMPQRRYQPRSQQRIRHRIAGARVIAERIEARFPQRDRARGQRRLPGSITVKPVVKPLKTVHRQLGDARIGIARHCGQQAKCTAHRLIPGIAQFELIGDEPHLIDRRQARHGGGQAGQGRRGIERTVIAQLPRIDHHRATAIESQRCLAPGHDRAHRRRAADRNQQGHMPAPRRSLADAVAGEFVLRQRQRGLAVGALRIARAHQRNARLGGEIGGDRGQPGRPGRLDRRPQVGSVTVAELVRGHIGADALPPGVFARISFEHGQHRFTLLIGDRIEGLVGFIDSADMLHDRMGGAESIEPHRRLATRNASQKLEPVGMEMVDRLVFHPAGEAFVEPQVVPPGHRDQIAKPLVRDFVGLRHRDEFARARRSGLGIVEQIALEREHRAPVFHRGKEFRLAGPGDVVDLGQRIGLPEIVVVIRNQPGQLVERELGLFAAAAWRNDPRLDARAGHFRRPLKVARAKEQEIRGHFRRGAEGDLFQPLARRLLAGDRHVADRQTVFGHDDRQIERRLVRRFVEHRRKLARIARLELGKQRAGRLAVVAGIVERKQAVGLGIDMPGIAAFDAIAARRDRARRGQLHGLGLFVIADGQRGDPATCGNEVGLAQLELNRVEHHGIGCLRDVDVDRECAGKRQRLGIGADRDGIVAGDRTMRQRAVGGERNRGLRQRRRRANQRNRRAGKGEPGE